jgi:excisionase family DNA binding protein
MYTVKEASEKLGLSPGQVRRLLRKDEIKGEKLGRDWLVLN